MSVSGGNRLRSIAGLVQAQDLAWLLLFLSLAFLTQDTDYNALILLGLFAIFQIAEPRLRIFAKTPGQIAAIFIKLLLCYLLIGYTHGIASSFYPILLVPIVYGATTFEIWGTLIVTAVACIAYPSFVLFINWREELAPEAIPQIFLRVVFYLVVSFVVYQQATAKRKEMKRTQEAFQKLEESNDNLRRAEASLRRSERLAALGQLTAGLAHELRNPLATIKSSAELLTQPNIRTQPELMAEMAGYISTEVDRTNSLISRFLDFARPLALHPQRGNLQTVFAEVLRQLDEYAKTKGVTLARQGELRALPFLFDADLLTLAIHNLMQNAIQASEPGQTVTLRVEEDDKAVSIEVSDHGSGIAPQHLENIFNPFFTTKPSGVGLGLAIVAKIVDEHRGKIKVESTPGQGTTFNVTLPRQEEGRA